MDYIYVLSFPCVNTHIKCSFYDDRQMWLTDIIVCWLYFFFIGSNIYFRETSPNEQKETLKFNPLLRARCSFSFFVSPSDVAREIYKWKWQLGEKSFSIRDHTASILRWRRCAINAGLTWWFLCIGIFFFFLLVCACNCIFMFVCVFFLAASAVSLNK